MPITTNEVNGAAFARPERPWSRYPRAGTCLLPLLLALAAPHPCPAQEQAATPGSSDSGRAAARSATAGSSHGGLDSPGAAEIAALREATGSQLRALGPAAASTDPAAASPGARPDTSSASSTTTGTTPSESALDKHLRELLEERLRLLEDFEKAEASLKKASHPEPSPERQLAEAKGMLVRLQALLTEAATRPDVLLPPSFSSSAAGGRPGVSLEMKDALEAAAGELKDSKARLDALRTEVVNWEALQNARRAERDKLYQVVAAMKARAAERGESAGTAPLSASGSTRRLTRERLINAEWRARTEAMRLQAVEAQIALEAKLAAVREQSVQVGQVQVQVAERTLEVMQSRYRAAAELQEHALKEKAAVEENKAQRSDDPLERFRARRMAEMLEIEAQVVRFEQALATSPPPSLEEQRSLADHAAADFARIKELLEDGRISRLDAIRLNNDFRRIGPERDRLLRNEQAVAETRLQFYEDALTAVELELLRDSVHDGYEQELLRERLPRSRWTEAEAMLTNLERSHRALLVRRRSVLEHLTDCTAQTLDQIARRLAILDEEYGFIRTHIFWVRDQDPIGIATITQGARECHHLVITLARLAQDSVHPRHWGRRSPEFVTAAVLAVVLPLGLFRLRRLLRARMLRALDDDIPPGHTVASARDAAALDGGFRRGLRSFLLGAATSAIWPSYLLLVAYVARQGPWHHSMSILSCAALIGMALVVFLHGLLRWLARPAGWAERHLGMPAPVVRQLGRAGRFAIVAAGVLLLPAYLIDNGLIAPDGRLLSATSLSRFLVLAFELTTWGACIRLLRGRSALMDSLAMEPADAATGAGGSRMHAGLAWISRRRRPAAILFLAGICSVIVLDVRGYSYSARRLGTAGAQTAAVIALCAAAYRGAARGIDRHVGRWSRPRRRRSWALALTSAMARRAAIRSRREAAPRDQSAADDTRDPAAALAIGPDDLAAGLKRLAACAAIALGLLAIAWLWELDLAFVRFLLSQPIWFLDDQTPVTLGDLGEAGMIILAGVLAWRYMSTIFALTLFHRIPDDPGVRFAVVTLCRYAVLAFTTIAAMGAIRLDLARIGVVLAAMGVGLGFGLQEIISNFVCGIILLLERPIRIGDVVTVAGTTGRVDRIHIRATTIVNADNQSMIVPNREFITGNLVNWTHKDKILRIPIKILVAYGSDPERVAALLLSVVRDDRDVVDQPEPSAMLEGFGESGLLFALYAFVPEPGLVGPARHRICAEIQRRFAAEGIVIPLPHCELHLTGVLPELAGPRDRPASGPIRRDHATPTPPEPHARPVPSLTRDDRV